MSNTTPPNLQNKLTEYINTKSPLHQIFLMDCLLKVSKAIIDHKEEVKANMKDAPINAEAWIQCAEDSINFFPEAK